MYAFSCFLLNELKTIFNMMKVMLYHNNTNYIHLFFRENLITLQILTAIQ